MAPPTLDASTETDGAGIDGPEVDAPPLPLDAAEVSHRIFISTASFTGNLGGLAGGDQKCQAAAEARGFTGQWRAHLSTGAIHARDRLPAIGRFVRVTGAVIANSREALVAGTLIAPILLDEAGNDLTPNRAWTGSAPNGTVIAGSTCNDWTLGTTTTVAGMIGDATALDGVWQSLQNSGCGGTQRLFCIEQ